MRALALMLLLAQAPVGGTPVKFAFDKDTTHESASFQVETETAGIVSCDHLEVLATERRCTATFPKTRVQMVRVRARIVPCDPDGAGPLTDLVGCNSAWSPSVSVPAGDVPGPTTVIRIKLP